MSSYFEFEQAIADYLFVGIGLACLLVVICEISKPIIIVFYGLWETFKKAGIKGYKSIIPFYNIYLFIVKICGLHWSFLLILGISCIRFYTLPAVFFINSLYMYNFAKRFHKNKLLFSTVGAVLPPIFIIVCGLSSSCEYDKKVKLSNCGYFNL